METKKCTYCEEIKNLSAFRYVPSRKVWNAQCNKCENENRRKRRAENPEKFRAQAKTWRENNPELVAEFKKKDGAKRRERAKTETPKEGFKYCSKCLVQCPLTEFINSDNIDHKICNGCREVDMRYYEAHKEAKKEEMRQYYIKNNEKIKIRKKVFYQDHKDEILEQDRNRYKNDIQFRLAGSLRRRVRSFLGSGEYYSDLLACPLPILEKWFEFNFALYPEYGMTWDNYGTVWHIDHVVPCSYYNMELENDVLICFNWKNLAPLPARINQSKNNKRSKESELDQLNNLKKFIEDNKIESTYL
jgi:hypothetical protein